MNYKLLAEPLTIEEIKEERDEDNYISGVVSLDLGDIIDHDIESFNDAVSEALVGSPLLMDISWRIVGCRPASLDSSDLTAGDVHLFVTGDASMVLGEEGKEGEEE